MEKINDMMDNMQYWKQIVLILISAETEILAKFSQLIYMILTGRCSYYLLPLVWKVVCPEVCAMDAKLAPPAIKKMFNHNLIIYINILTLYLLCVLILSHNKWDVVSNR